MYSYRDYEIGLVALAIWREAQGEPREGQIAVGQVIANNCKSSKVPLTWHDLIDRKNYLSSMTHIGDGMTVRYPDDKDAAFKAILPLAEALYGGELADNTDGAMFYANLDNVPKDEANWFYKHIVLDPVNHPVTVKIGHHTFFR